MNSAGSKIVSSVQFLTVIYIKIPYNSLFIIIIDFKHSTIKV